MAGQPSAQAGMPKTIHALKPGVKKKCRYCHRPAVHAVGLVQIGAPLVPTCNDHLMVAMPDTKTLESKKKDPTPGLHDTSPVGHNGNNWITQAGGDSAYIHEIVHALMRGGKSESEAEAIAHGTIMRWARGEGNVTPATRAKAQAAMAHWAKIRAIAAGKHVVKAGTRKSANTWDNHTNNKLDIEEKNMTVPDGNQDIGHVEYKAVPVGGINVVDEGQGIVTALMSVTGLVDNVNDNIEPGVYSKALAVRTPKGVWAHSWETPVSKTVEAKELMPGDTNLPKTLRNGQPWPASAGALSVTTQFNLKTSAGRDAFENVKFYGDQAEWSIGYRVPVGGGTVDQKTGVRTIRAIELYEYSPVLFGAMPEAVTQSVKSAQDAYRALTNVLQDETKTARAEEEAMPDINTEDDVTKAVNAYAHAKDPAKMKKHIIKHAKAINKQGLLPAPWQAEDEKKALDTTPEDVSDFMDPDDDGDDDGDGSDDESQDITISAQTMDMLVTLAETINSIVSAIANDTAGGDNYGDVDAVNESDLVTKDAGWESLEIKDGIPTSVTDLIGFLSGLQDDIENYDDLEELAGTIDSDMDSGNTDGALQASSQLVDALTTAADDSSDQETVDAIGQVGEYFGQMLQNLEDMSVANQSTDTTDPATQQAAQVSMPDGTKGVILETDFMNQIKGLLATK